MNYINPLLKLQVIHELFDRNQEVPLKLKYWLGILSNKILRRPLLLKRITLQSNKPSVFASRTYQMFHSLFPKCFVFCLLICACLVTSCYGQQGYRLGFYPAESVYGVEIQSVIPNSPMTRLSSSTGQLVNAESRDVIVSINGNPTPNVETLRYILASMTGSANQPTTIQLRNWRNGQVEQYTVMAVRKSANQDVLSSLIGLSEAEAMSRARALNFKPVVRSRDGVGIVLTAVYRPDGILLDIVNGIVTAARVG